MALQLQLEGIAIKIYFAMRLVLIQQTSLTLDILDRLPGAA